MGASTKIYLIRSSETPINTHIIYYVRYTLITDKGNRNVSHSQRRINSGEISNRCFEDVCDCDSNMTLFNLFINIFFNSLQPKDFILGRGAL